MFGSFEITSIRLYTPLRNTLRGLHGVYNLIEVISSWTEQKLRSILNYFELTTKIYIQISIQRGQIMTPCRWPRWFKYVEYTSNRPLFYFETARCARIYNCLLATLLTCCLPLYTCVFSSITFHYRKGLFILLLAFCNDY